MTAKEEQTRRAWIDESGSDHARDPGTYILAAVILATTDEEHARTAMKKMRLPGQNKVHWRDESTSRRRKIAAAVATLPAHSIVVVRSSPLPSNAERARRKCFEQLIWQLTMQGVSEAVFESRGTSDDKRDSAMLDNMRRTRSLPRAIRIDHVPGRREPILWIPDAVCGSIVESRCGERDNFNAIASTTRLYEIN